MNHIDTYLSGLTQRRQRAWNEAQNLLDHAATQRRDMTAEENQSWSRMMREIDDLDAELRDKAEARDRAHLAASLRDSTLSVFGGARVGAHDLRAGENLRQWLTGANDPSVPRSMTIDLKAAFRERELLRQGASPDEIRALAWDASSGSLTVPTTFSRTLVEVLEANIAALRMGATKMVTTSGENMTLPVLATHAIGTQVSGQGTTFAGTDPVFTNVALPVYKFGQLIKASSELVQDAAFDIGAFIARDLGYSLARVVDTDLILGTGTGEPTGYTTLAGAGTNAPVKTGGSLIAPTVEKYLDALYTINDNARERAVWLAKDSTAGTIRKLRDGAGGTVGAFLWDPSMTNGIAGGQPDRFLGKPFFTDANCAAQGSNAIVATIGDPTEYVIRTVGDVQIDRDDSVFYASDEYAYRGKWRVGGAHTRKGDVAQLVMNV